MKRIINWILGKLRGLFGAFLEPEQHEKRENLRRRLRILAGKYNEKQIIRGAF